MGANDGLSAVLFDGGNTLVHVDYPRVAAHLSTRGQAVEVGALKRAQHRAEDVIDEILERCPTDRQRWIPYFDAILAEVGIEAPADRLRLISELAALDRASSLWCVVEPETTGALERLNRLGLRLGVVSNSDGRIEGLLESLDLARFFEVVVDSGHFGIEKPDPRIFGHALRRMGVPAERCLYVGDLFAVDVVGARAAGMRACLFGRPPPPGRECPWVRSLDELVRWLEEPEAKKPPQSFPNRD